MRFVLHDGVSAPPPTDWRRFLTLCLAATGVVYGDIGTSPLYTWNEVRRTGVLHDADAILGACSLLIWTLTLAITVKYVGLVLRADNHGEGGTFALMGLVGPLRFVGHAALLAALAFAACLLYADGLITPAISVLSAVEGLAVASPAFEPVIVPLTLALLTGLFTFQWVGTERVGRVFGVVCVGWFAAIGLLGLGQVVGTPAILKAFSPHYAIEFLTRHRLSELGHVLGAVVLAITGGEALYADIGHFGVRAVRFTWLVLVYPALLLAYLGQGAFLLSGAPVRADNVFYSVVPESLLVPMVVLASAATVIASQALISGAFSLTRSAITLGFVPRFAVRHTSAEMVGQIYLPMVNWGLWAGCCALVLGFRTSAGLAAAYGLAVMGVVVVTTVALAVIASKLWSWPWWKVGAVFVPFLAFDGMFLAANVAKIPDGAWVTLVIGAGLYFAMDAWRRWRALLAAAYHRVPRIPLSQLIARRDELTEIPRAFLYLVAEPVRSAADPVPVLLMKFIDRYGGLPRNVTLFTVVPHAEVPYTREHRFEVDELGGGVVSVRMHVGFMERADVRAALRWLESHELVRIHAVRWTIVVGREEVLSEGGNPLWRLRMALVAWMSTLSVQVHEWFGLGVDPGVSKELVPVRARSGAVEIVVDRSGSWVTRAA